MNAITIFFLTASPDIADEQIRAICKDNCSIRRSGRWDFNALYRHTEIAEVISDALLELNGDYIGIDVVVVDGKDDNRSLSLRLSDCIEAMAKIDTLPKYQFLVRYKAIAYKVDSEGDPVVVYYNLALNHGLISNLDHQNCKSLMIANKRNDVKIFCYENFKKQFEIVGDF